GGAVTASAAVVTSRAPATHVRTAASAKAGRRTRRGFAAAAPEGDGEEGGRCDPPGHAKTGEVCAGLAKGPWSTGERCRATTCLSDGGCGRPGRVQRGSGPPPQQSPAVWCVLIGPLWGRRDTSRA